MRLLLACVPCCIAVLAGMAPAGLGETIPATGRILDSDGGKPVAGATILVGTVPQGSGFPRIAAAVADSEGVYHLTRSVDKQGVVVVYKPGFTGYSWNGFERPSPETPEITLTRERPSCGPPAWYGQILADLQRISYIVHDDGLNPAIRLRLFLESIPELELLLGRIEGEELVRGDLPQDEQRITMAFEWRDAVERDVVPLLERFLKEGDSRRKMLALAMLAPPDCRDFSGSYSASYESAMSDSDPQVRELALIMVRRRLLASHARKPAYLPLPDHLKSTMVVQEEDDYSRGRSACVSPRLLALVRTALADAEPRVRMEAAVSIGLAGERDALPSLARLADDPDPFVRAGVAFAVGELRREEGIALLGKIAAGSSRTGPEEFIPRTEALRGIRKILVHLSDRNGAISGKAREAGTRILLETLGDPGLSCASIGALSGYRAPEAVDSLKKAAAHADPRIRRLALTGLFRTADSPACTGCFEVFRDSLKDADRDVRISAIRGLGAYSGDDVAALLIPLLNDPDEGIRRKAAAGFRDSRPESVDALVALIQAESLKEKAPDPARPAPKPDGESVRQMALRSLHFLALHAKREWLRGDASGIRAGERLIPLFPSLNPAEKQYAAEVIALAPKNGVAFIQERIRTADGQLGSRYMEIGAAYYPRETLQLVADTTLKNNGWKLRETALLLLPEMVKAAGPAASSNLSHHATEGVRRIFFEEAGKTAGDDMVEKFLEGLADPAPDVRNAASLYFQSHREPRAVPLLVETLGSVPGAKEALKRQEARSVAAALVKALERRGGDSGKDIEVKNAVFSDLYGELPPEAVVRLAAGILRDYPDSILTPRALVAIGLANDPEGVAVLARYAGAGGKYEEAAVFALASMRHPSALASLKRIVDDPGIPLARRENCVYGLAVSQDASRLELIMDSAERWPELRPRIARHFGVFTDDRKKIAGRIGRRPEAYREILAQLPANLRYLWGWKSTGYLLAEPDPMVVRGAVLLLAAGADKNSLPGLRNLAAESEDAALKALAEEAVSTITKHR